MHHLVHKTYHESRRRFDRSRTRMVCFFDIDRVYSPLLFLSSSFCTLELESSNYNEPNFAILNCCSSISTRSYIGPELPPKLHGGKFGELQYAVSRRKACIENFETPLARRRGCICCHPSATKMASMSEDCDTGEALFGHLVIVRLYLYWFCTLYLNGPLQVSQVQAD